jgi:hypothetical protein
MADPWWLTFLSESVSFFLPLIYLFFVFYCCCFCCSFNRQCVLCDANSHNYWFSVIIHKLITIFRLRSYALFYSWTEIIIFAGFWSGFFKRKLWNWEDAMRYLILGLNLVARYLVRLADRKIYSTCDAGCSFLWACSYFWAVYIF